MSTAIVRAIGSSVPSSFAALSVASSQADGGAGQLQLGRLGWVGRVTVDGDGCLLADLIVEVVGQRNLGGGVDEHDRFAESSLES
jgi:hypothetical protein